MPTREDEEHLRKETILEILEAQDVTLAGACLVAGFSVSSLFYMRRADPGFDADVRDLYEANGNARVARVESAFYDRLTSSPEVAVSTSAFIFYLTNRAPDRWRHTSHLNVGGPDGGPLEIAVRDAKQRLENRVNRIASRLDPVGVPVGLNGDGGP